MTSAWLEGVESRVFEEAKGITQGGELVSRDSKEIWLTFGAVEGLVERGQA